MALYTSNYLKGLSQTKTFSFRDKILNESKRTHTSFDIFLSHSFLDKDEVEGLYIELTNQGFSVYVDWIIDPQLDRNNVTKATATLVRSRMKSSKMLLLAVSMNAAVSKWMPWELGYMDAHTGKCAIVPITKETSNIPNSYKGVEYLSLYPFIKKQTHNLINNKLWVIEEATKYVAFDEWFKTGRQPHAQYSSIY